MFKNKNDKNKLLFLVDGLLINGAYFITTGILLSGYAIYLGADDFLTALMNNCANYAMVFSLMAFIIFKNRSKRKKLLLTMNLVSRFLMALIIFLPLLFHEKQIVLPLLFILVVISEIIFGIYRVGWMVWMMSSIPKETKSEFIYIRTFFLRLFMSFISIVTGIVLDMFNKGYFGFVIIFSFSFVLSLLDIIILNNADEPEYEAPKELKLNLKNFLQPFYNKEYRNYLFFIFIFYMGLTMASSFTPTYMIRYLNLDYKLISSLNVITHGIIIISSLLWVRVEKERGFRYTLGVSALFTAGELLILTFVTKDTWPLLFISSAMAGLGTGGFGNSTFTYRYEIMPQTDKTIYEGWFYFSFALSMLAAPFIGKILIDLIPEISGSIFTNSKIQLLYLIAFIFLCLYLFFVFVFPSAKNNRNEKAVSN